MDTEKEIKLKKILMYHRQRRLITKKQYKRELDFIKQLKQSRDGEGK